MRLLVDLLVHEVVVAALLGGGGVPVDLVTAVPSAGLPSKSDDLVAVGGDRDDLVLAELERVAGVVDERRDVGAEEHLAVADADDQRGLRRAADDEPGLSACTASRVNAPSSRRSAASIAVGEVAHPVELAADQQVRRPRCRSRRGTPTAVGDQLRRAGRAKFSMMPLWISASRSPRPTVRVGVAVGGAAVGGPAGVADARCARAPAGGPPAAERRFSSLPARFSEVERRR